MVLIVMLDSEGTDLKSTSSHLLIKGSNPTHLLYDVKHWVWTLNIRTRSFEELCLDNRHVHDADVMILPFAVNPMPTAISAMAWGTSFCPKVEKIFGHGHQYVTAEKMILQLFLSSPLLRTSITISEQ